MLPYLYRFGDFFGLGHANDKQGNWSSTACRYQTEPHGPFPEPVPVDRRLPNPLSGIERWA